MASGASKKLYHLTAALMLSVSFAAIDRAEAACTPTTSILARVNNTIVTCSDTTLNQNGDVGWGTAVETGDIINIQTSASVTGTGEGINVGNGTLHNGTTSIAGGTIVATQAGGVAISAVGTITVGNFGDGVTTGIIRANGQNGGGIGATNVIVSGNSGLIEAMGPGGIGIFADVTGDTANITTSGIIRASSIAVVTDGLLTLNNGGSVTSGGTFAVVSNNGDVTVTNSGTIRADNGTAIHAGGQAMMNNIAGATISGAADLGGGVILVAGAIEANGLLTLNNAGLVASGGTFAVVSNNSDVTVTNSGAIRADNGVAIQAAGKATVNNLTGGNITAGGTGIIAGTLDITNAFGATISGGGNGVSGSGVVRNAGTISGGAASVSFTGPGPNTLALQTGSLLVGDAIGGQGAFNALVLEGHGATISTNNFLNFNLLDVRAGANWVWNTSATTGATIGATAVNGTLTVNGVLVSPVTVNSGGTLAGQGTVTGVTVNNGGAIAPGATAPLSTLNVTGGVTFSTGSIYRVSVDAAGHNDKLMIGANANLAGTVNVLLQNGFLLGTPYTILTANGGLGGTRFSGVSGNFAFVTPTLAYDTNDVFLTFAAAGPNGTAGFASAAQTRNQLAVARALDASPLSNPLVSRLLTLSISGARAAFDALSGEIFGSIHNTQGAEASFARGGILGRLRQASYAAAPGELGILGFAGPELAYAAYAADANGGFPVKAPHNGSNGGRDLTFWAQGLGGWGHADSDGNATSLKSRFGGFLSGADARLGDAWRAGLVAGYMRTDLNVADRASSAGIDSVQFGAYAGAKVGAFNVRGGASYSYDSIDTSRGIFFPGFSDKTNAHFHGNVGQVFGEVGYGMALGSVALEPLAGLVYVHVRDGAFNEAGGLAALTAASANQNTGYTTLGLRAATAVPLANGTVLIPRGSLQWQHAFGDVTPVNALAFQSTGTSFTVAGIPIARNSALLEAGFDWRFSPHAKLGAFYQAELAAHAETHAVKGAFTWNF